MLSIGRKLTAAGKVSIGFHPRAFRNPMGTSTSPSVRQSVGKVTTFGRIPNTTIADRTALRTLPWRNRSAAEGAASPDGGKRMTITAQKVIAATPFGQALTIQKSEIVPTANTT